MTTPNDACKTNSSPPTQQTAQGKTSRPRRAFVALLVGWACAAALGEGFSRILVSLSNDPMLAGTIRDYSGIARNDLSHFRFVPDEALVYRLKPGFTTYDADGNPLTVHNQDGFRATDDFAPKAPGTYRIVCLGGSTTYGVTVEHNAATYPAALERYLNGPLKPNGVDRVEVLNLGVGGYTSLEVLANLRLHALPLKPDHIIVQSAINDVAPRFYPEFACDYRHFRKPMALKDVGPSRRMLYRSYMVLWTGYKLGVYAPITLQSQVQHPMPHWENALMNLNANGTACLQSNIQAAVREAAEAGVTITLMSQAFLDHEDFAARSEESRELDHGYRQGLDEHNAVVKDVATDTGVQIIDLAERMPYERRYFADPIHMTEQGNNVKARLIADSILKVLP